MILTFPSQKQGAWRITWRIHPKIIPNDPDLPLLIEAWLNLPAHIKQTIKTLLDPFLPGSAQSNTLNKKMEGDGDE
ncbi:hypothetical protein ACFL3F_00895 [Planctomycetota bacterium]